ncbi:MAG TPA: cobalamin biosynthesis protein [Acidimicrobiales bacterium]
MVGVGVASRAEAAEVAALVEAALREAGVARERVAAVATVAARAGHPAVTALGWPVVACAPDDLAAVAGVLAVDRGTGPARAGAQAAGGGSERRRPAVAEPAALLAAGPGAVLVVPKRRSARATVAVARAEAHGDAHTQ